MTEPKPGPTTQDRIDAGYHSARIAGNPNLWALADAYRAERSARENAEAACAAYREILECARHWEDTSCPDSEQLNMLRESYARILREENCGKKMLEREAANLARANARAESAEKERDEARAKLADAMEIINSLRRIQSYPGTSWDSRLAAFDEKWGGK